jgi:predicted nucleotidyltransferase
MVSEKLWQSLKKSCKSVLKKIKIDDIIIFGSIIKGKDNPDDIDVCLIGDCITKKELETVQKKIKNAHLSKTSYKNITKDPILWKTLLHEGFSIKNNVFLAKALDIKPFFLYTYSLTTLTLTKKQIFSHALYGTKQREGILKECHGEKLGKGSILIPQKTAEEIRAFFETWNIIYKIKRVWM